MKDEISINASDAMPLVTIKVRIKGLRRFRIRLWITTKLFLLAALVSGMKIEIET